MDIQISENFKEVYLVVMGKISFMRCMVNTETGICYKLLE